MVPPQVHLKGTLLSAPFSVKIKVLCAMNMNVSNIFAKLSSKRTLLFHLPIPDDVWVLVAHVALKDLKILHVEHEDF